MSSPSGDMTATPQPERRARQVLRQRPQERLGRGLHHGPQQRAPPPMIVRTVVDSVTSRPGYTTYRVGIEFGPRAADVYALFGEPGAPLRMPPCFQVPTPFGSHVGPTNPAFFDFEPDAEFDSFLTIGMDGPALQSGALSFVVRLPHPTTSHWFRG